jgi:RHS repeat-associated protein
VIDKSTNTAIYEPGTYNARGQMNHYAIANKSIYTTLEYDAYGLPTFIKTGQWYPNSTNIQYLETNFNNQTGNLNWRKDHSRNLTENFTYDAVHKNRLATWQVQGQQQYGITYNHANGNIITKTDFTSPGNPYTYGLNAGPHAVTGVNAPLLMPAEAQQEISYNSFNKASYINHNYQRRELFLHYGPDEQRIKTEYKINGQTTLTRYFPGGGLEVEVDANGQERWLHYLPGGGLYVCDKNFNKIGMYYVLTDYLGSWHKVISETGTTIEEYSFDPWGRRRNPANWTYTGVPASFTFSRGYTGHVKQPFGLRISANQLRMLIPQRNDCGEMLDAFGLVNMNGRMYDPVMGRMLSPDNYVSSASSTQAFNRYSYALNNPLVITDPTGDHPAIIAGIAYSAVMGGLMSAQSGDGFMQGFSTGMATGMLTYGVGAAIGPVVSGGTRMAMMVNAGIHTAISGTLTYGMDALINDSPFNWKGYGMNIATSMAMAGLSYQKPSNQSTNNALAKWEDMDIQTDIGRGYGASYVGGDGDKKPKNTRTYKQRHDYNREELFFASISYSRGFVGGGKYSLFGMQFGFHGGAKYSKHTLGFSNSGCVSSFEEKNSSFGFGYGIIGGFAELNHKSSKTSWELSIGPLVIGNSDNPFLLRIASGYFGGYGFYDGAFDINLSGVGPDTKYVTPLMPADNTYYYTNPYNQWKPVTK